VVGAEVSGTAGYPSGACRASVGKGEMVPCPRGRGGAARRVTGKSPPRPWRHGRPGKPHPGQGQI